MACLLSLNKIFGRAAFQDYEEGVRTALEVRVALGLPVPLSADGARMGQLPMGARSSDRHDLVDRSLAVVLPTASSLERWEEIGADPDNDYFVNHVLSLAPGSPLVHFRCIRGTPVAQP